MKRIYSSSDLLEVELRKAFLANAGLRVEILHAASQGARGEVPVDIQLVVLSENDIDRAIALLKEFESGSVNSAAPWRCPSCGEECESQFSDCWKCGGSRCDN
jgi:hypothetical protein